MRRDEVCLKCGNAFPLFDHDDHVVARRPLGGQAAHGVDRGKVLQAAAFGTNLGNDLAKLGEKFGALARLKLDRGEDDNHWRRQKDSEFRRGRRRAGG
jgi:hypothetical protein